jgi:FMN phosphatase YigB (HAD superfamily)
MTPPRPVVFLMDVDNTLLDNDKVAVDVKRFLDREVGRESQERYFAILEDIREQIGYTDYLASLQRYRLEYPHHAEIDTLASFLVDYPFANRLHPGSLDVLERLRGWGPVVLFSDGDVVFQPRKIERAGLRGLVDAVLIYVHKELELEDVEQRFPAERYVLVDDKLRTLAAVKMQWDRRVTTVFPRQGRYARDVKALASYQPADLSIPRIADLLGYELPAILNAGRILEPRPSPLPRRTM